jgi:hypothetical protein
MGLGSSDLKHIESRGMGNPTGVGGLEHSPDPSLTAGRLRLYGVRALGVISIAAFALIVKARLTGNVRERGYTKKSTAFMMETTAPPPPGKALG